MIFRPPVDLFGSSERPDFDFSCANSSQRLQLSEDVAGATFMAAGSSAPELFTSIIGNHHIHISIAIPLFLSFKLHAGMCLIIFYSIK